MFGVLGGAGCRWIVECPRCESANTRAYVPQVTTQRTSCFGVAADRSELCKLGVFYRVFFAIRLQPTMLCYFHRL